MTNSTAPTRLANPGYVSRPRKRPGRKPKGSVPIVVVETPDKPDPTHVLTWRQRKVLQVIRDSVRHRGYPPSMQEIADAVGLTSPSSVLYQVGILQRKGYLHRDAGRPRTMEVRLPGRPPVRPEGAVVGEGTLLLLEMVGDAAIADGDWVVVRRQENATNRDTADEAKTLGRVVEVLRRV
jgi:repressor LexA